MKAFVVVVVVLVIALGCEGQTCDQTKVAKCSSNQAQCVTKRRLCECMEEQAECLKENGCGPGTMWWTAFVTGCTAAGCTCGMGDSSDSGTAAQCDTTPPALACSAAAAQCAAGGTSTCTCLIQHQRCLEAIPCKSVMYQANQRQCQQLRCRCDTKPDPSDSDSGSGSVPAPPVDSSHSDSVPASSPADSDSVPASSPADSDSGPAPPDPQCDTKPPAMACASTSTQCIAGGTSTCTCLIQHQRCLEAIPCKNVVYQANVQQCQLRGCSCEWDSTESSSSSSGSWSCENRMSAKACRFNWDECNRSPDYNQCWCLKSYLQCLENCSCIAGEHQRRLEECKTRKCGCEDDTESGAVQLSGALGGSIAVAMALH